MMTLHEFHDMVVRTIPAAVGTALYAFTALGPVAWLTCAWVTVQMTKFCIDWYRSERDRRRKARLRQEIEDLAEKDYP